LGRLDIPFVDYYERTKGLRWEDLYSGTQGHWRASGHQEAATLLRSLLVTLVGGAHDTVRRHLGATTRWSTTEVTPSVSRAS